MTDKPHDFDPLVDRLPSRFVVGIDLGTTNCAVTYIDTSKKAWKVQVFPIPQLVGPREVESRETLPSFHFQPPSGETTNNELRLPWSVAPSDQGGKQKQAAVSNTENHQVPIYTVGFMARDEGTVAPGRLIASAKSWLCHTGVDRTADLLPWHHTTDVDRLSPVEVSSRYLQHIRDAWNHNFPKEPLSEQDIVITLPASFDEVARELTVEAARRANLKRVVLIEEPQAAFYAWIDAHAKDWEDRVRPGQNILVCDIGGGTSDFTLIRVLKAGNSKQKKRGGKIQFHRVAVGNHLILGGDNLDLTLAEYVERKLIGDDKLKPRQWGVLVRSCRHVKETLLGKKAPPKFTVNLPGSGSKVIGGSLQVEVTCDEVNTLLVDGFLPHVKLGEKPQQRQSGFQEFGLPYAPDAAITRYLSDFLTAHREVNASPQDTNNEAVRPDIVLLNGGFFASPILRKRLLEVLTSWFLKRKAQKWKPVVLDNKRLDLAVARGAAYYGMVCRGKGVRIAASLARSYYISVESDEPSVICLVPGDAEPGHDIELSNTTFDLLVSQPVEFPLYVSSTRLTDRPGDLIPIDVDQMTPLPPIRTVLKTRRKSKTDILPVHLHARLTEIGTIDLWCAEVGKDRSWRLQFDIRSTTQTDIAAHDAVAEREGLVDEDTWRSCRRLITEVFSQKGNDKPGGLMKRLGKTIGCDRSQWPPSLLRRMWEALMELYAGRKRSAVHEARWLNLLGYALRPGYGIAVDDWRVAETWRHVRGKLAHHSASNRNESLILWRRLAGGLSSGQQTSIAEPQVGAIRGLHGRFTGAVKKLLSNLSPTDSIEVWRLLGSLELLDVTLKIELAEIIVDQLKRRKLEPAYLAMVWALGRLGQRTPAYGPLNTVVPAEKAESWTECLIDLNRDDPVYHLAVMQLARRTNDRYRDISERQRQQSVAWLGDHHARDHLIKLVRVGGQLDTAEQGQVYGEAMPKGLRLRSR